MLKSYNNFKVILENHYHTNTVVSTLGTTEMFEYLKKRGIKIALTTGFYREVTDIILNRLNWSNDVIDCSVASDEVVAGRPAPFMIFRAMEQCGITDVRKIIKIGDTPSDLGEGKNAGCKFTFGITNGTHTEEQLQHTENDGLFSDMLAFKVFLQSQL
jgi:phosphonatase-like hydrolase